MFMRPIRVFVFHQVSDVFEPETMWDCDWTQTEVFKRNISALMKKYKFISLEEVRDHLALDKFRFKSYAALTADDGWASLKNILPWLVNQKIPVTLFLNPSVLDGRHWNSRETDKLLTGEEVVRIVEDGAPYISVASHGWTHISSKGMSREEFVQSVDKSEKVLERLPAKVPFFAFASGLYRMAQVAYLRDRQLTPVFVDSEDNETDPTLIHRYCIDGVRI
jgi:peptidoglycan/xylan/chitin deacetylase (PgdA/CDA1 family)